MVYDTRPVSSTARFTRPDGIVKRVLWPSNKPMKMTNALGTESAESQFRANPATVIGGMSGCPELRLCWGLC
jgi:hypothetical protein